MPGQLFVFIDLYCRVFLGHWCSVHTRCNVVGPVDCFTEDTVMYGLVTVDGNLRYILVCCATATISQFSHRQRVVPLASVQVQGFICLQCMHIL